MAVLSSVLEEIVESFAGQSFKKQTIKNAMKNRGVKNIELEQSGILKVIDDYEGEKVPVEVLKDALAKRPDKLEQVDVAQETSHSTFANIRESEFKAFNPYEQFGTASVYKAEVVSALRKYDKGEMDKNTLMELIRETSNFPGNITDDTFDDRLEAALKDLKSKKDGSYKAKVLTRGEPTGVTTHFTQVPNYYSHVRMTDVPGDGRYIHELQSDVHGAGEKHIGFSDSELEDMLIDNVHDIYSTYFDMEHFNDVAFAGLQDLLNNSHRIDTLSTAQVIEHLDLENSLYPDKTEYAGLTESINRAIAKIKNLKAMSGKFENKDPNWLNSTVNKLLVDAANEGQSSVKFRIADDRNLHRAKGVQQWYEKDVVNTLQKTAKKIGAEAKMTDDGYFEIKLPEKDFKLPLYTSTGIAVIGTSAATKAQAAELPGQIQQAREAGYDDEEIKAYLSEQKTYDPNVLQRAFMPKEGME